MALLGGMTPQDPGPRPDRGAVGLLTVEARHAAWARNIVGATPGAARVRRAAIARSRASAVARTHFIVQPPKMVGTRTPRYTG